MKSWLASVKYTCECGKELKYSSFTDFKYSLACHHTAPVYARVISLNSLTVLILSESFKARSRMARMSDWDINCKIYVGGLNEEANK